MSHIPYAPPSPHEARLSRFALGAFAVVLFLALVASAHAQPRKLGHWTLWQLPQFNNFPAMSYVLQTSRGRLIVVDGGWEEDAPALSAFIRSHGNRVTAWFITHPHNDHVCALNTILSSSSPPAIERIYASMPPQEFVQRFEPLYLRPLYQFHTAVQASHVSWEQPKPGKSFMIDDLRIEILSAFNPEIHVNAINNSSLVFRVSGTKSILFLGDLGVEGGQKLLRGPYCRLLHADYVQMAHHGQGGVDEAFYRAVQPTVCLWPTPSWMWLNDAGKGPGTGPWDTLHTRKWMDELGVRRNYVSSQGIAEIKE